MNEKISNAHCAVSFLTDGTSAWGSYYQWITFDIYLSYVANLRDLLYLFTYLKERFCHFWKKWFIAFFIGSCKKFCFIYALFFVCVYECFINLANNENAFNYVFETRLINIAFFAYMHLTFVYISCFLFCYCSYSSFE